jgi:hypothetical protein
MRFLYRLLSVIGTASAASNGNLGRNLVRKQAHKSLARGMRKMGL